MAAMKTTTFAAVWMATAAATIALPATAHADDYMMFQSPSGNIHCHIDSTRPAPIAMCQIYDYTYAAPPASSSSCPPGAPPGSDFRLDQGKPAYLSCRYANLDSGFTGVWPTLDYGQTRSTGTITCNSEPSGMTCTDSSTGHFFRVSRESYQLG